MRAFAFLLILLAAIVIGVAHVITTMAKKRKLIRDPRKYDQTEIGASWLPTAASHAP